MADLMNDTCTFSELENTYGNFRSPAAKILIDGSAALPLNNAGLKTLELTLSLHCASSAVIKIAGAYDRKNRNMDDGIKGKFSLGKILEVELGYLSETKNVFKGFIASVVTQFTEEPEITITVMDVRRLMMLSGNKEKYYDDENYSDIVSAIMSPYSKLCSLEQESSSDGLTKTIFQKMSDYHFITEVLTKKTNKEFFVVGEKAYFRKPKNVASEIMSLEFGLNLISFIRQSNYLDCNVIANSYDKKEQTALTSEAAAVSDDTQTAVLSTPPNQISVQEDAETEGELQTRAEQVVRELKDKALIGRGKCIGLPELVPGRFIKLDKMDGDANQKYYIVEVKHYFGESGFYTEFETEGSA